MKWMFGKFSIFGLTCFVSVCLQLVLHHYFLKGLEPFYNFFYIIGCFNYHIGLLLAIMEYEFKEEE